MAPRDGVLVGVIANAYVNAGTTDGNTTFDYTNWDLEIVRIFFFSVKPVVKPHFHLEGTLTNDA